MCGALPLWATESVNSVGMTMVSIPAGTFKMGQEKRNLDYRWHCSLEIGKVGLNTVKNLKSMIRRENERDGIVVGDGKGGEFKGFGLYAALSWDDGKTWPVKRLILPKNVPVEIEGTDGGLQKINATHAEPNGYLAMAQDANGRIHLHPSRNDYVINLAWLTEGSRVPQ